MELNFVDNRSIEELRDSLITMLVEKSFRYSESQEFTLASGRKSQYYINCKPVTMHPKGIYYVGRLIYEQINYLGIKGVGGLTFGADPIAVGVSAISYLCGDMIKAFSIRKENP